MAALPRSTNARNSPADLEVVEAMTRLLTASGLAPVPSRMWAFLLVADPPDQTAASIAEALQASRGSISAAARLLETAGMVQRSTRPGDRKEYFRLPAGSILGLYTTRMPVIGQFREAAEAGLDELAAEPAERGDRLRDLRDLFAYLETELPAIFRRYADQRKERRP